MSKWDYEEEDVRTDVIDNKNYVYVTRRLFFDHERLDNLPRLAEALGAMMDGFIHTEVIEAGFWVDRAGPRSKPSWGLELTLEGSRKATSEEKKSRAQREAEKLEREAALKSFNEKQILRELRKLKKEYPHLYARA